MRKKHGVFGGAVDGNADRSPKEGYVVEAVLEDFGRPWRYKNISNNSPSSCFILVACPIASVLSPGVIERYNDSTPSGGGKADASNLVSSCFNIHRNSFAGLNVSLIELLQV